MRVWRLIGRIMGVALLSGALIAIAAEGLGWWRDNVWEIVTLGAAWVSVNANSLIGLGAFVEKSISPWLWIEIMVPLLTLPLWLVLGLPCVVLVIATRRKRRMPMFYKR